MEFKWSKRMFLIGLVLSLIGLSLYFLTEGKEGVLFMLFLFPGMMAYLLVFRSFFSFGDTGGTIVSAILNLVLFVLIGFLLDLIFSLKKSSQSPSEVSLSTQ